MTSNSERGSGKDAKSYRARKGVRILSDLCGPSRLGEKLLLTCLGLCLVAPGCGSSLVIVKGRVTEKSQPLLPGKPGEWVLVTFYTYSEGGEFPEDVQDAHVNQQDGTFEVRGRDGRGIPPGKYRVGVQLFSTMGGDRLKGRFGAKNSPFVFDVTGKQKIDIDIANPPG